MLKASPKTYWLYGDTALAVIRRFGVVNSLVMGIRFLFTRIQFKLRVISPITMPPNYYLFMTKRCNLSCSFCHYHSELDKSDVVNDEWEWKVEDLASFEKKGILKRRSKVCLYGGEPMLNADFFACVDYLNNHNYLSSTITNAAFVTKNLNKLLSSPLHQMTVSYYKGIADQHVKSLREISHHTILNISYILTQETYHHLEEVILFSLKVGARFITIENLIEKESCSKHAVHSSDDYKLFKRDMIEKYGSQIIMRWSEVKKPHSAKGKIECSEPWDMILLDKKGRILPCCQYPLSEFEDTLANEKFATQSLIEIRKKMKSNIVPRGCEGCHYLYAKDPLYNLKEM